jgi:hypothetical protein
VSEKRGWSRTAILPAAKLMFYIESILLLGPASEWLSRCITPYFESGDPGQGQTQREDCQAFQNTSCLRDMPEYSGVIGAGLFGLLFVYIYSELILGTTRTAVLESIVLHDTRTLLPTPRKYITLSVVHGYATGRRAIHSVGE